MKLGKAYLNKSEKNTGFLPKKDRARTVKPPKYRSIGTVLFSAAVQVSDAEGMNGRIGLHSLPAAASWYLKLGLIDFGPDQTVQNLNYFELSSAKAKAFLDEMKD